jgi:DNA-binding NarL/FixJ family response regulator
MLKAMIVEDHISFREFLRDSLLSQYASMEVFEAGNGEEALKKFASYPFDLIFMNIRLPGENGLEITRKIKANRQDITVIILSSYNWPEYRNAAIRCGANGFISKESLELQEIFTIVKCHQEAKQKRSKPTCIGLASGRI